MGFPVSQNLMVMMMLRKQKHKLKHSNWHTLYSYFIHDFKNYGTFN